MNRHAAMARRDPVPWMCPLFRLSEVALSHHERFSDGAGYPGAGWPVTDIPLVGPHRRRGRTTLMP